MLMMNRALSTIKRAGYRGSKGDKQSKLHLALVGICTLSLRRLWKRKLLKIHIQDSPCLRPEELYIKMPIKFNKETSTRLFRYVKSVDIKFNRE